MNIIEAAEAAKAGKRVQWKSNCASWTDECLRWECADNPVTLHDNYLTGWRIIPDPPKLYPFSEAFERMKQGKWMKSIASDKVMALYGLVCHQRTFDSGYSKVIEPVFTVYEIEGRWQEVME